MADVVVIAGVLAMFAITVGLVWACDRIVGPDPELPAATAVETAEPAR